MSDSTKKVSETEVLKSMVNGLSVLRYLIAQLFRDLTSVNQSRQLTNVINEISDIQAKAETLISFYGKQLQEG